MSGKSHWLGYWARELPKQDLRFPTGWEEIREGQKTLTLLLSLRPDLSTKQTPAFLLPPVSLPKPSERMALPTGEPQLNRGPNSYTCAPASAVPSAVPCTAGLPEISEERDLLLGKLRNAPTQFSAERPGTGLTPTSLPGRKEDDLNQKLKRYEEQSGSASRF